MFLNDGFFILVYYWKYIWFGMFDYQCPEPETDVYRIEIDNFNILAKKNKVILRVKDENQTSHK